MSKEIPQDRIDSGDLTEAEIEYLHQRGQLPKQYYKDIDVEGGELAPEALPTKLRPHTGDVNTGGLTVEDLKGGKRKLDDGLNRPEDEDDNEDEPDQTSKEEVDDEEDDEEEGETQQDYQAMNNDARRAELANRGLVTTGNKQELIARLERSDANELLEEDQAEEEDDDEDEED